MNGKNENFPRESVITKWGDTIEERRKVYKDRGIDKIIEEKKENWWLECFANPTDESIRLAKEFYKFWCKYGVLQDDLGVDAFKKCYARANAHWATGEEDEYGNDIYILLNEEDIL